MHDMRVTWRKLPLRTVMAEQKQTHLPGPGPGLAGAGGRAKAQPGGQALAAKPPVGHRPNASMGAGAEPGGTTSCFRNGSCLSGD